MRRIADEQVQLMVELGRAGKSAYAIARDPRILSSEKTVARQLRANGVSVRPAACSAASRERSASRAARAVALYVEDETLSAREVAEAVGVSESQVFNYLRAAGVPARQPFRLDESFRSRGHEVTRAMIAERDAIAARRGLWTREQVARYLVLRLESVVYLERVGALVPCDRVTVGYGTFPLYRPRDVKLHARARHRSADHRVRVHRDPEWVRRWARRRGYTKALADRLASRADERARREASARTGTTTAEQRHDRWAQALAELQRDNPDVERSALLGDVALLDWQTHPEDWPRASYPAKRHDPADFADAAVRKAARDRVRKALAHKMPA